MPFDPPDDDRPPLPYLVVPNDDAESMIEVRFRVDPTSKRAVNVALAKGIATGIYPWETQADIFRWLVAAGLWLLPRVTGEGEEDDVGAYRVALDHVDEARGHLHQAYRLLEGIRETVADYLKMGKRGAAVQFLHLQRHRILDMPRTPPRDWLLETLATDYPELLARRPSPAALDSILPSLPDDPADLQAVRRGKDRRGRSAWVVDMTPRETTTPATSLVPTDHPAPRSSRFRRRQS